MGSRNTHRAAVGLACLAVVLTSLNVTLVRYSIQTGKGIFQTAPVPLSLLHLAARDHLFYPTTLVLLALVLLCSWGAVGLAISASAHGIRRR